MPLYATGAEMGTQDMLPHEVIGLLDLGDGFFHSQTLVTTPLCYMSPIPSESARSPLSEKPGGTTLFNRGPKF